MWAPQMTNHLLLYLTRRFFKPLKIGPTFPMSPKRVRLTPPIISSVLRILHQDAAISLRGITCTPSAPPGPPVRSTSVLVATTVWAPPTAGELQSYSPGRPQFYNLFFKLATYFLTLKMIPTHQKYFNDT